MSPTKYDFMRDMLLRARNRHRKKLGLCPEQPEVAPCPPEPCSSTDGHPGAFDGKAANPVPLKTWFGKNCGFQCCTWEDNEETGGPAYKEAHPALIFCDHTDNSDDHEGNCTEKLCPLSE